MHMFFENPPRVSSEAKEFLSSLSRRFAKKAVLCLDEMEADRCSVREAKIAVLVLCQDPILSFSTLEPPHSRIKPMSRVLLSCVEEAERRDWRKVEKRIVGYVLSLSAERRLDLTKQGASCIAACILHMCGILVRGADEKVRSGTIHVQDLKRSMSVYRTSAGKECRNDSLLSLSRFVSSGSN